MALSKRFSLKGSLLGLSLIAELLCLSLGIWQYMRWEEKKAHVALVQHRLSRQPLSQEALTQQQELYFRRVSLKGRFLHTHEKHLQARVEKGRFGVRVVTPFQLEDGRVILIDRGFSSTQGLASLQRQEGSLLVEGVLLPLPQTNTFTPINRPQQNSWYVLSPRDMFPLSSFHQMYVRLWKPDEQEETLLQSRGLIPPQRHRDYMLTWFGLALALLIFLSGTLYHDKKKRLQ